MKHALCFLAGTVLTTIAVVLNGGHVLGFAILGFLIACSLLTAVLYFAGLRRTARFLNALVDALEGTKAAGPARVADRSGYVKPSRKNQIQMVADTIEEYKARQSERHAGREIDPATAAVLSDPELFGEDKKKGKVA
jgi:hypothetical protein